MAHDDYDNSGGFPGETLIGNAIQVWAMLQCREKITVKEAAKVFNISPFNAKKAIESHPFMFITGPDDDYSKMYIEHEGE